MGATGRELPHSFEVALKEAQAILSGSEWLVRRGSVQTESEQIVMAASGLASRMELYARLKDRLPEEAAQKVIVMAMARAEGRILQHLTGFQDFLEHRYEVGPQVLVPRPETEFLVTTAIERLSQASAQGPRLGIEIGLGSGVISIELLSRFRSLEIVASELTAEAQELARRNAVRILGSALGRGTGIPGERLEVLRPKDPLDVLEPFLRRSDLHLAADFLISNPPYLVQEDAVDPDVREWEPETALFAPEKDSLHFYRAIAERGRRVLGASGQVFLEMPSFRAVAIDELFVENGWQTERLRDLAGEERVLIARVENN